MEYILHYNYNDGIRNTLYHNIHIIQSVCKTWTVWNSPIEIFLSLLRPYTLQIDWHYAMGNMWSCNASWPIMGRHCAIVQCTKNYPMTTSHYQNCWYPTDIRYTLSNRLGRQTGLHPWENGSAKDLWCKVNHQRGNHPVSSRVNDTINVW